MFCIKCGSQVPDGANFCNACGARMKMPTQNNQTNNQIINQPHNQINKQPNNQINKQIISQPNTPRNSERNVQNNNIQYRQNNYVSPQYVQPIRVQSKKKRNTGLMVTFFSLLVLLIVLFVGYILTYIVTSTNDIEQIIQAGPEVDMSELLDWDKGEFSINNIGDAIIE